jgi:hypothetical protein
VPSRNLLYLTKLGIRKKYRGNLSLSVFANGYLGAQRKSTYVEAPYGGLYSVLQPRQGGTASHGAELEAGN